MIPVPDSAGLELRYVHVVNGGHDPGYDGQDENIEIGSIGLVGAGMTRTTTILTIFDGAPAIGTGTQGARQYLGMGYKNIIFAFEPPEAGKGGAISIR